MFKLVRLLVVLLIGLTLQGASAQTPESEAANQARAVIQAQLDAFAADDAQRAFSFASPGTRARFGTAENFMTMVRNGYPAVYRPASVSFLPAKSDSDSVVQPVNIADEAGRLWIAIYQLVRQTDSSWILKAANCFRSQVVVPDHRSNSVLLS